MSFRIPRKSSDSECPPDGDGEEGDSFVTTGIIDVQAHSNVAWLTNGSADVSIASDTDVTIDGVTLRAFGTGRTVHTQSENGHRLQNGTGGLAGLGVKMTDLDPTWDPDTHYTIVEMIIRSDSAGEYSTYGAGIVSDSGSAVWGATMGYHGWSDPNRRVNGAASFTGSTTQEFFWRDVLWLAYVSPSYPHMSVGIHRGAIATLHHGQGFWATQPTIPTDPGDAFIGGSPKVVAASPPPSTVALTTTAYAGFVAYNDTRGAMDLSVQKLRVTTWKIQ